MKTQILMTVAAAAAAFGVAACATATAPASTDAQVSETVQSDKNVDALNSLASIAIDAEALYRELAQIVDNADLKAELLFLAGERAKLAAALQTKVAAMGGVPAEAGQALGFGHRIFTDMRSAFENDEKVAASEVLRGEQYLVDKMNEAISDAALGAETTAAVSAALPGVEADRDRVLQLARKFGADV